MADTLYVDYITKYEELIDFYTDTEKQTEQSERGYLQIEFTFTRFP